MFKQNRELVDSCANIIQKSIASGGSSKNKLSLVNEDIKTTCYNRGYAVGSKKGRSQGELYPGQASKEQKSGLTREVREIEGQIMELSAKIEINIARTNKKICTMVGK